MINKLQLPLVFLLQASFLLLLTLLLTSPGFAASSCPNTSWQASNGRTCANMGLNSNQATCNGGQYATACDDTRSQFRTCSTRQTCNYANSGVFGGFVQQNLPNSYGHWPNNQGSPSWSNEGNDFILYRGKRFHCTEWNYRSNRPCKSGRVNEDCRGGC